MKKKEKQSMMHELNTKRPEFGDFSHLLTVLRNNATFCYFLSKMRTEDFSMLVDITTMSINKIDTNCRRSIVNEKKKNPYFLR